MMSKNTTILATILSLAILVSTGSAQSDKYALEEIRQAKQQVNFPEPQAPLTPPANDNFADAVAVPLFGGTGHLAANNTDATKEPGEGNHAENIGGKSVWFKFTSPATTI